MKLDGVEFLRRFLLHVLPKAFVRIRHFGLLANRVRNTNLAACHSLLGATPARQRDHTETPDDNQPASLSAKPAACA